MARRSARLLLPLMLASPLLLPGCAEREGAPPHIVLFSVDTLRADHLGYAGHPHPTSPRIDAFARRAWRFEQAFSVIPKTAPAMATAFTGRHPREHGVRSNFEAIPDALPTLAEHLQTAGYRSAAFVANPALRPAAGFDRGFDTFVAPTGRDPGMSRLLEAYLDWAQQPWERPTFVWIHTLDPHGPYRPPVAYEALFEDVAPELADARLPVGRGPKVLGAIPRYQVLPDRDTSVAGFLRRYNAEIRLVDDVFARVLDDLAERGRLDGSAVVLTADHGESLGEHDYYFEHGWYAYEPGLRVPLLVKEPGQRRGRRVEALASNLDLLPTLAALAGVPVPAARGRDLLARPHDAPDAVVVESSDRYPEKYLGLRTATHKYLRRVGDGHEELYDLTRDPGELENRADADPERTAALRAELERRLARLVPVEAPAVAPSDPETEERLRSLGYVR